MCREKSLESVQVVSMPGRTAQAGGLLRTHQPSLEFEASVQ